MTPTAEHPYWLYRVTKSGTLRPLLNVGDRAKPRQKLPEFYVLNGAVRWHAENGFNAQDPSWERKPSRTRCRATGVSTSTPNSTLHLQRSCSTGDMTMTRDRRRRARRGA